MKLLDIKIFPINKNGWESDKLVFGDHFTQLYGPNGCGKTPLVQSIAYCLGFPSVFRNDIYNHCSHVELNVECHDEKINIKRVYSRDVDIEVIDSKGRRSNFYNEKDYSSFIFEKLGIKTTTLVSNNNSATYAYIASFLPIYYLDQDDGYSKLYHAPNNFIRDQFSEIMRMILRLPVKNSFDIKKSQLSAKQQLELLDKRVNTSALKLKFATQSANSISRNYNEILHEISSLEQELEALKSSGATHDDSLLALDRLVNSNRKEIRRLVDEIYEVESRTLGINNIVHEINVEIETLNLNEEARRVFLSFNEICGSSSCSLFSSSSDSYSKNLLYLKDQIKDLQRNADADKEKIDNLKLQKTQLETVVQGIIEERNKYTIKSEISALVDSISEIKNKIFSLQSQKDELDSLIKIENTHIDILKQRDIALEKYQSYTPNRESIPSILKIKSQLRELFIKWLNVIHTTNISFDITFKDDFIPVLGTEQVSQLKGSTKIRAVLAYHAALIELMAINSLLSFKVLILDTPKQHEIHNDDLNKYILQLKLLCQKYGIQVVFSTTEYRYIGDMDDIEWNPIYKGSEQLMFLRQPN
ncbi:ATP-binding protein [Shewanella decolorationis]|uniref:ATP-binding protein n=1 Tax=Shewanella decolorationis TaxID=256839 RepID=UPI0010570CFF|nr:ATP-binding protein [Shewanella decolorationis]